jgi:hypothetical protein
VAGEVVEQAAGPEPAQAQVRGDDHLVSNRSTMLHGRVVQADLGAGADGRLLKARGSRRSSRCRSCSDVYGADAWQLIAAGLRGGKGVPEAVADHPRVFVTFTAPGFGPVHAIREHQGRALPCQPHGPLVRCPHAQPVGCWAKHEDGDPALGTPLCRGVLRL